MWARGQLDRSALGAADDRASGAKADAVGHRADFQGLCDASLGFVAKEGGLHVIRDALGKAEHEASVALQRLHTVAPTRLTQEQHEMQAAGPMLAAAHLDPASLGEWGLLSPEEMVPQLPLLLKPGDKVSVTCSPGSDPLTLQLQTDDSSDPDQPQAPNTAAPTRLVTSCAITSVDSGDRTAAALMHGAGIRLPTDAQSDLARLEALSSAPLWLTENTSAADLEGFDKLVQKVAALPEPRAELHARLWCAGCGRRWVW